MINKRMLSTALTAELSRFGFTRRGSTWYRRTNDVIAVLNLQKSNFDATYFLNLGFWLRTIEELEYPREEQCHVLTRAEELWPTGDPNITELLEECITCDNCAERINSIRVFVREHVVPLLIEGSTIPGLTVLLKNHNGFLVQRVAQVALGLAD